MRCGVNMLFSCSIFLCKSHVYKAVIIINSISLYNSKTSYIARLMFLEQVVLSVWTENWFDLLRRRTAVLIHGVETSADSQFSISFLAL
jgi:hypothetical protein